MEAVSPTAECQYGLFSEVEDRPSCTSPVRMIKTTASGHCCAQLDKGQDFVTSGHANGAWFGVVADGHGVHSRVIGCLRDIDWPTAMALDDPIGHAISRVEALGETIQDGATLSLAKVSGSSLKLSWLGDSQIRVLRSGENCWWNSALHRARSASEREGARRRGVTVRGARGERGELPLWDLEVLSPNVATVVPSYELVLGPALRKGYEDCTPLSRCLGHNRRKTDGSLYSGLSTAPQYHSIPLSPGQTAKLIIASDGLWDVMSPEDDAWLAKPGTSAELMVEEAARRWAQEWIYRHPESKCTGPSSPRDTTTTISEADDVSVVVWNGSG